MVVYIVNSFFNYSWGQRRGIMDCTLESEAGVTVSQGRLEREVGWTGSSSGPAYLTAKATVISASRLQSQAARVSTSPSLWTGQLYCLYPSLMSSRVSALESCCGVLGDRGAQDNPCPRGATQQVRASLLVQVFYLFICKIAG